VPSPLLVHLNNINDFSNEIVELARDHIREIPLPVNFDPTAKNLEDFRARIAEPNFNYYFARYFVLNALGGFIVEVGQAQYSTEI